MSRVYVAGHRGMAGSALLRRLAARRDAGVPLEIVIRTNGTRDRWRP